MSKPYEVLEDGTIKVYNKFGIRQYCIDHRNLDRDMIQLQDISSSLSVSFDFVKDIYDDLKDIYEKGSIASAFENVKKYPRKRLDINNFSAHDLYTQVQREHELGIAMNHVRVKIRLIYMLMAKFDNSVIIDESVEYCNAMFSECSSFNQSIIIPEVAFDCHAMFNGCKNLKQTIKVPDSVKHTEGMFEGCPGVYDEVTRIYSFNDTKVLVDQTGTTSLF